MEQFKLEHSPIVYYVSGREHREWVLFLHAAFADHNMFRAQTEYFRDSYNVLTVDVIGHGQSTDTAKGDGIDKMSVWIYDILKVENCRCLFGRRSGAGFCEPLSRRGKVARLFRRL